MRNTWLGLTNQNFVLQEKYWSNSYKYNNNKFLHAVIINQFFKFPIKFIFFAVRTYDLYPNINIFKMFKTNLQPGFFLLWLLSINSVSKDKP